MKKTQQNKKIGVMDRILVVVAIILVLFTIAVFVVFWHTGTEPAVLVGCVFGVCGVEYGIMGWIKTTKERIAEREERGAANQSQQNPDKHGDCVDGNKEDAR